MFPQFYHTRCSSQQSVIGQEGFTIRGSSLTAEEIIGQKIHQLLVRLAAYELPADCLRPALGGILSVDEAPVRLARIKTDQGMALVHSVFRPDAGDRNVNYFSHIILMPNESTLGAAQCLATWGTENTFGADTGWVWQDSADESSTDGAPLPSWSPGDAGSDNLLSIEHVRDFLLGQAIPENTSHPSLALFPKRLQSEDQQTARRALLESLLAIYLSGRRVLLFAEPGLTALLSCSVAQLLPRELSDSLTFSTYESAGKLGTIQTDIVGTTADTDVEKFHPSAENNGGISQLDSFAPATPMEPFDEAVSTYVTFALAALLEDKFSRLTEFWDLWRAFSQDQPLKIDGFLDAWDTFRRIQMGSNPLSHEELDQFLDNDRTRRALFTFPSGREQAVRYALRQTEPPHWWPTRSDSPATGTGLLTNIDQVRTIVIDEVANELQHTDNLRQHLQRTTDYLSRFVPGITDETFCLTGMLDAVMTRLDNRGNIKNKHDALPWSTRREILTTLLRQGGANITTPVSWLRAAELQEIFDISKDNSIPDTWKGQSLVSWFEDHPHCEPSLGQFLLANPELLNSFFQAASKTKTPEWANSDNRITSSDVIDRISKSLPTTDKKLAFFITLLHLPNLLDNPDTLSAFAVALVGLTEEDRTPWQMLFKDDSKHANQLIKTLGTTIHTAKLVAAWCHALANTCLRTEDPQHAMLNFLVRVNRQLFVKAQEQSPDNEFEYWDEARDIRGHWIQIFTSAFRQVPNGTDWYKLRWSMKSLKFSDPYLVSLLIQQASGSTKLKSSHYHEIVECGKVILPPNVGVIPLVNCLIEAVDHIPDTHFNASQRNTLMVSLLTEACGMNAVWYDALLGDDFQLPQSVVTELIKKQNEIKRDQEGLKLDLSNPPPVGPTFIVHPLTGAVLTTIGFALVVVLGALAWKLPPRFYSTLIDICLTASLAINILLTFTIVLPRIRQHRESKATSPKGRGKSTPSKM